MIVKNTTWLNAGCIFYNHHPDLAEHPFCGNFSRSPLPTCIKYNPHRLKLHFIQLNL